MRGDNRLHPEGDISINLNFHISLYPERGMSTNLNFHISLDHERDISINLKVTSQST